MSRVLDYVRVVVDWRGLLTAFRKLVEKDEDEAEILSLARFMHKYALLFSTQTASSNMHQWLSELVECVSGATAKKNGEKLVKLGL